MSNLLEKHNALNIKGVRELSHLISSKQTQIRAPNSKSIYTKFYTEILPQIETLEPKEYIKLVKDLSKEYRTKKTPAKEPSHTPSPSSASVSPIKQTLKKNPKLKKSPTNHKYNDETFQKLVKKIKTILHEEDTSDEDEME
jgi:hypothetical protein